MIAFYQPSAEELDAGPWVIVRTYSAGVHYGRLLRRDGKEVALTRTRRIHRWIGANSLHGLALHGCDDGRVSEPLDFILLTEAIELLPLAEGARAKLEKVGWNPSA